VREREEAKRRGKRGGEVPISANPEKFVETQGHGGTTRKEGRGGESEKKGGIGSAENAILPARHWKEERGERACLFVTVNRRKARGGKKRGGVLP